VRVAHGFGAWDGMIEGAPQSDLEKTWPEGHVALFVTDMGGAAVTALFGPGAGAIWAIDIA
jgi:hypothetical protein